MPNHLTAKTGAPATAFTAEETAQLLRCLTFAEVKVETTRSVSGVDYDDPGMRDFTASLSLPVSFIDLEEAEMPAWAAKRNWAGAPDEAKRDVLAKAVPALAVLANDMTPDADGAMVELATVHGAILNPDRHRGDLFGAVASRSQEHAALYPALTTVDEYGEPGLKRKLRDLVEGVGDIVLLTGVRSSPAWEQVEPGLEAALMTMLLQDVAVGACAVLTHVGKLSAKSAADKAYTKTFWAAASFVKWKHGIWYTSPNSLEFEHAAWRAEELLLG